METVAMDVRALVLHVSEGDLVHRKVMATGNVRKPFVTEIPQNSQHRDPNLSLSEKPCSQDKGTWGVVSHACVQPLGRRGRIIISLRLCCEFRASLGYTARPCLEKEKKEMESTWVEAPSRFPQSLALRQSH